MKVFNIIMKKKNVINKYMIVYMYMKNKLKLKYMMMNHKFINMRENHLLKVLLLKLKKFMDHNMKQVKLLMHILHMDLLNIYEVV